MNRSTTTLPDLTLPRPGLIGSWTRFWFNPSEPFGFHLVRFLAGLLFPQLAAPPGGLPERFLRIRRVSMTCKPSRKPPARHRNPVNRSRCR